jgi:hypothetical protein
MCCVNRATRVTVVQVFYFGIIDFLQYYNVGKKAEHMFKSAVSNPLEIRCAFFCTFPFPLLLSFNTFLFQCC